ncbi:MAG: radical SAM protein [Desulfobacterales bacterium]|nr:radical SAM protein [Desulfobacterales bacterium]
MKYEGTTYRPPPEADSLLLQVTVGCAHNRCRFCAMYRDVQFRPVPLAQIEADIEEAWGINPRAERIFLVNGDALVLPTQALEAIAGKIHKRFTECRTISMYASIRNIRAKSDRELAALKALGVDDLYVGVESGWDRVLARIDKGHTAAEAERQLARLNQAGINHVANLMLGVAGQCSGQANARRTADFINRTGPGVIWVGTLAIFEGTELHADMVAGRFVPATELEILEEEKALIDAIELDDVRFYGVHPTNTVRISGRLPQDKTKMIAAIDAGIETFGPETLSTAFSRTSL